MIFKRILINNFGGLREKDIELTSGVNVLYGLKETEMNIVFIFVKSMFFGAVSYTHLTLPTKLEV